jgi:hypothetical protein
MTVEGKEYEVIPAQLIVKAGLVAASRVMEIPSPGQCCPGGGKLGDSGSGCCPK